MLAYENKKIGLHSLIYVQNLKGNQSFTTTYGRVLFNSLLPNDFPYQNEAVDDGRVRKIINDLIYSHGFEKTVTVLDNIKETGFLYSGLSGISWGLNDLIEPKEKAAFIKEGLEHTKILNEQYNEGLLSQEEKIQKLLVV